MTSQLLTIKLIEDARKIHAVYMRAANEHAVVLKSMNDGLKRAERGIAASNYSRKDYERLQGDLSSLSNTFNDMNPASLIAAINEAMDAIGPR